MGIRSRMPILLALALAAAGGSAPFAAGAQGLDQPGDVHLIRPEDLPPPFQTSSANNPPQLVARPAGAELRLPAGFHADLFYDGTLGGDNSPRTMALAPNGDVFVVNSGGSTLYVLRDANGDGKAEGFFTFATKSDGLNLPLGSPSTIGSSTSGTRTRWCAFRTSRARRREPGPRRSWFPTSRAWAITSTGPAI
jgi:glucose/arabinose dehydrogenase